MIHRISAYVDEVKQQQLNDIGIEIPTGLATFEVSEEQSHWSRIRDLIAEWQCLDLVRTEFTEAELEAAEYLRLVAEWHFGYPQPKNGFGYLAATYDLSDYCKVCGTGARQQSSFRLKGEPKWGKRHIFQLNWVFDQFFVMRQVWEEVFQPLGIKCMPVLEHRADTRLATVVQLAIDDACASVRSVEQYPFELCTACGRNKLLPIVRGSFPALSLPHARHTLHTREYFGSGASAWRATIVSREFFECCRRHKLAGVSFIPVVR